MSSNNRECTNREESVVPFRLVISRVLRKATLPISRRPKLRKGESMLPPARPRPLAVPIDINYRCSARARPKIRSPSSQQMERISDISGEKSRLRSAVALSSQLPALPSPCFHSFSPIRFAKRRGSFLTSEDGRKTGHSAFLSHSLSTCSFTPLSVAPARLLTSGRHHLSFCQLGDFNLLSFCAITGPRGPRKIVFNCD